MPSNEESKNYELQVSCKDYSFMSVDKLVGATSIGLGPIQDQGNNPQAEIGIGLEFFIQSKSNPIRIAKI